MHYQNENYLTGMFMYSSGTLHLGASRVYYDALFELLLIVLYFTFSSCKVMVSIIFFVPES